MYRYISVYSVGVEARNGGQFNIMFIYRLRSYKDMRDLSILMPDISVTC